MLWLVLVGQLSLPAPANARTPNIGALFSADDFPTYLMNEGHFRKTVYTRTTVRPDGSVENCAVETSSGDRKLDEYTCTIIVLRGKFLPAKWVDGTPVYGVMRAPVSWTLNDSPPSDEDSLRATVPDLDLSVNRLPEGARSIVGVSVQIAADEKGRPVSCIDYPPHKGDRRRHFRELIPIACRQVMANLSVTPPIDSSGKSVRSVQNVSVHFKAAH